MRRATPFLIARALSAGAIGAALLAGADAAERAGLAVLPRFLLAFTASASGRGIAAVVSGGMTR